MKLKDPIELLLELGVILEYNCGMLNNRPVRYVEHTGSLDVGEHKSEFDRWANSLEMSFDLLTPKGQRAFIRWVGENNND